MRGVVVSIRHGSVMATTTVETYRTKTLTPAVSFIIFVPFNLPIIKNSG